MKRAYLGIDHVVIRTTDAQSLFDLLSGPLGLPVTWRLERAAFATFGWVGVGNTNLEIWAAENNSDLPVDCTLPLFHQIALEPGELSKTMARLRALGFSCKEPRTFKSTDQSGQARTNFTNSVLLDMSSDLCRVFCCEWGSDAPIVPWKRGLTTPERRELEQNALAACGGGSLGLVALREIALATPTVAATTERWLRLTESKGEPIAITDDVTLRLSIGTHEVIESLTFVVRDLNVARRFLGGRGLLGMDRADQLSLAERATSGLMFYFVEAVAGQG